MNAAVAQARQDGPILHQKVAETEAWSIMLAGDTYRKLTIASTEHLRIKALTSLDL